MSTTTAAMKAFLEGKSEPKEPSDIDAKLKSFLSGSDESNSDMPTEMPTAPPPRSSTGMGGGIGETISEYGGGATDTLLNTLNIQNEVFNWASSKLGSDFNDQEAKVCIKDVSNLSETLKAKNNEK